MNFSRVGKHVGSEVSYEIFIIRVKFTVLTPELANELRSSLVLNQQTRFSETNNFRVEHFSRIASEGLRKCEIPEGSMAGAVLLFSQGPK